MIRRNLLNTAPEASNSGEIGVDLPRLIVALEFQLLSDLVSEPGQRIAAD